MPRYMLAFCCACSFSLTGIASADFITPDTYGWSREDAYSIYTEWDVFQSPTGGNVPDVGFFPFPLPDGWAEPDVIETSGSSFITSGGNIYSFQDPTDFDVTFPNYGFSSGKPRTTILVQTRTLGNELDYSSMRIGSVFPHEIIELDRQSLDGFGGYLVDTLFRFELQGNASDYLIEFNAAASSMSLDRLAIDSLTRAGIGPGGVHAKTDARGVIPIPAPMTVMLLVWGAGITTRRSR